MNDEVWEYNQANRISFVMIDGTSTEVPGLGAGFTLQISKNGGAFAASAGVKAEIGNGWYTYLATAAEADTVGPVAIRVTGAGCVQQNLEYVVKMRAPSGIYFTYTLTSDVLPNPPIFGATISFSTDIAGVNIVWTGTTDVFGIARDVYGQLPYLQPGTYRVWRSHPLWVFVNPDVEVVS